MAELYMWVAPAPVGVEKGVLRSSGDAVLERINVAKLNSNLKSLAQDLEELLQGVEAKGGFNLSEIEIGVEVTAEAGVTLIGTAKVGGTAALTLRFCKG
jgi:hypothetical protein